MQNIIILITLSFLLLQALPAAAAPAGFELDLKELRKPSSPLVTKKKKVAHSRRKKKTSSTSRQPATTPSKVITVEPSATVSTTTPTPNPPSELDLKGGDACQLGERLAVAVARSVPVASLLHNLPLTALAAISYDQLDVLITCKLQDAEAYTYERLLEAHEVQLVNIKENETTEQVAQRIIEALDLPYQREADGSKDGVLVYLFPANKERQRALRLTIHP
jgi:hypothetical protein